MHHQSELTPILNSCSQFRTTYCHSPKCHLSLGCKFSSTQVKWNIHQREQKNKDRHSPTYLITSRQGLTANSLGLGLRVFHTRGGVCMCVREREREKHMSISVRIKKLMNLIKTKDITLQVKFNLYEIITTEVVFIRYFPSCN